MTADSRLLRATALTLTIGALGAALFWLIGFPAAILTGPAAAVSAASVAGVRVVIPERLRDACLLVLGLSIGSTITPDVIATARAWPLSLLMLSVCLVVTLVAVRFILRRGFGFDRTTSLLAATPGHLSFVLSLSTELRADVPKVALVQSVRVLLLTLLVPLLIGLWGAEGQPPVKDTPSLEWIMLLGLFVLALASGMICKRLRVPAPFLIGGIFVSALGHGSDLTPGTMPPGLMLIAFVIMGSLIGTRFNGVSRAAFVGALGAGIVATLTACALAAIGAWLTSMLIDIPIAAVLLAFAPGGVEVMAALAVETGLEPAFVAAHHVFRILLLTVLFPLMMMRLRDGSS